MNSGTSAGGSSRGEVDRAAVAAAVGEKLGLDRVYAEQSPDGKLAIVKSLRAQPHLQPVVMVGDGINDAPALALADVGIALGSAGATVSSETADVVVLVDRIDRVVDAVKIGRPSLALRIRGVHRRARRLPVPPPVRKLLGAAIT